MRWKGRRRSDNVEFRKGATGAGLGGIAILLIRFIFNRFGIGGIVVLVGGFFALKAFNIDPLALLNGGGSGGGQAQQVNTEEAAFVQTIVASTEEVWTKIFRDNGQQYPIPKVIVFQNSVNTACGGATAASGPFYCPGDQQIYFDLTFFDELARRFEAPGDFAQAYVIAHEVGHHVQTVTGISRQVRQHQQAVGKTEQNALQVRMELQADCYAGIWAHHSEEANPWLEAGDVEEALAAATAIGDDTLQRQSGRPVRKENFTHGSAAQRVQWFRTGLQTGSVQACDTFDSRNF